MGPLSNMTSLLYEKGEFEHRHAHRKIIMSENEGKD